MTQSACVTPTHSDASRVRDVIHNFNADGFEALYPKYQGGRPRTFTLPERRDIKKIASPTLPSTAFPSRPGAWPSWPTSRSTRGVDDISHEGLRVPLREEGVSFQRIKTWKTSRDPDYAAKKARVEHLYAIADVEVIPEDGEPEVVLCMDEFGPLNLQPLPDGNGPSAADGTRPPTGSRGPVGGRPTPGRTGSGTCSPPTTWPRTSSTATSSRRRTGRGSFSSAATCAASIRRTSGSPSCSRSARSVAIPEAAPEPPGPYRRRNTRWTNSQVPAAPVVCLCPAPRCAHEAGRGPMKRAGAQPASGVMPCSLSAGGEGSSRAVSRSL